MKQSNAPSVFKYIDYRQFIYSCFTAINEGKKKYSYADICPQIGIKSTGHLTLILQGKANISIPLALRIARFLSLNKRESEYFQYLVLFNQAKNHADKRQYFDKIITFKEASIRLVETNQYEYYSKWYNAVVRALLPIYKVKDDFTQIAKAIIPSISHEEVRASIELMERIGMVIKDQDGYYMPADAVVDTGSTVGTLALTSYAMDLLDIGKASFDRFEKDERVFSWVTLGISKNGYEKMVQELRLFRQRLYEIANEEQQAERVYQINIQMHPVSEPKGKQ